MPKFRPEIHDEVEDLGNKRDLAKNKRAQKFAQKGQKNRKLDFQGKFQRNPNDDVQEDEVEIGDMVNDETRKQLEAITENREEQEMNQPTQPTEVVSEDIIEVIAQALAPYVEDFERFKQETVIEVENLKKQVLELNESVRIAHDNNRRTFGRLQYVHDTSVQIAGRLAQIEQKLGIETQNKPEDQPQQEVVQTTTPIATPAPQEPQKQLSVAERIQAKIRQSREAK